MLSLDFWNLAVTIINLVVLYLLLRHFLIQPVTAIMEKRKAMIAQQLENARNAEGQASDLKLRYEEKLKATHEESARLLEGARQEARREYDRLIKEADGQAGKIIENAQKNARLEKDKALRQVEGKLAELVSAAAAKVVSENSSEAGNQSLYNQFLTEAGGVDDSNRN